MKYISLKVGIFPNQQEPAPQTEQKIFLRKDDIYDKDYKKSKFELTQTQSTNE